MAEEFSISLSVTYASTVGSGLRDSINPDAITVNQTNPGFAVNTQSVGTGTTTLDVINDVTNPGLLYLQNMDSENSITYGSSLLEFRVSAGKFAWLEVSSSSAVVYCATSTGTVRLFAKCYEK